MVRVYCAMCHIRMKNIPSLQAKKPIMAHYWHDHFQINLIDFRKFARKDVYVVTMWWLMTVKDHSTRLTAVFAIPRKCAKYVAHKLDEYFGWIGYPTIFHMDNGNEFTAKVVIDMLKQMNPSILTITGRPRTHRDQGSIDWTNKTVKRMLSDLCAETERKVAMTTGWNCLDV